MSKFVKKYEIALAVSVDMDENPKFRCEDLEELTHMIRFFFKNDYDVYIREIEVYEPDLCISEEKESKRK